MPKTRSKITEARRQLLIAEGFDDAKKMTTAMVESLWWIYCERAIRERSQDDLARLQVPRPKVTIDPRWQARSEPRTVMVVDSRSPIPQDGADNR
jgi:hypothetical protein